MQVRRLLVILSFVGCQVVLAQEKKNVLLIDNWLDSSIAIGPEDAKFNDLWVFSQNDLNFAVIGSTRGAHFFQVHADSLEFLGEVEGRFSNFIVRHRDYKKYGDYIYAVCDEGPSSLQIIDVSNLPESLELVYDEDSLFTVAHNLFIDQSKAKMYVCSPDGFGMKVYDIQLPLEPQLIYTFTTADVHDCYVRDDTAFLNCGFNGLKIYDFEFAIPTELGVLDFYPNQGFNHSGWMNQSGSHYAFVDEDEGARIKLCRLGNYSEIQISETFGTQDYLEMVPHNIVLLESLAIVAYYKEGLRIFDFGSLPVREVGAYDTFPIDADFDLNGAWGVGVFEESDQILISDRQNGLFLFSFPIRAWENGMPGTFVTSTPFLDENGILISREYFREKDVFFTITTISGQVVYEQENYLNWLQIPLDLAAGTYIYGIFDKDRQILEGGKFVKAN